MINRITVGRKIDVDHSWNLNGLVTTTTAEAHKNVFTCWSSHLKSGQEAWKTYSCSFSRKCKTVLEILSLKKIIKKDIKDYYVCMWEEDQDNACS